MSDFFAWVDVESSGASPYDSSNPAVLLQVALVLTTVERPSVPIAEFEGLVKYSRGEIDDIYKNACENVQKMHNVNGLWDDLKDESKHRLTLQDMDARLVEMLSTHGALSSDRNDSTKNTIYLAGNSIFLDREFINAYLPRFAQTLHYRMIDVSTVQNFATWEFSAPIFEKKLAHTALSDIHESIDQYIWLRNQLRNRIS